MTKFRQVAAPFMKQNKRVSSVCICCMKTCFGVLWTQTFHFDFNTLASFMNIK